MPRDPSADNRSGIPGPSLSCAQIRELFLPMLDGELIVAQQQAVQRHLDACAACRHEWESYAHAEQALAAARLHIPPPGDLRAGFYSRLAQFTPTRRKSAIPLYRLALPVLAACLIAVVYLQIRPVPSSHKERDMNKSGLSSGQVAVAHPSPFDRKVPQSVAHLPLTPNRNPFRGSVGSLASAIQPNHGAIHYRQRRSARHHRLRPSGQPSVEIAFSSPRTERAVATAEIDRVVQRGAPALVKSRSDGNKITANPPLLALDTVESSPRDFSLRVAAGAIRSSDAMAVDRISQQIESSGTEVALNTQEVSIHVTDEQRGFSDSIHISGEARDDAQVISVNASDTAAPDEQSRPEDKTQQD